MHQQNRSQYPNKPWSLGFHQWPIFLLICIFWHLWWAAARFNVDRICSITFFDFYTIVVTGLCQKIWIFVIFAKLLRGDIHKTMCTASFLVAGTRLYTLPCRSVGRYVGTSHFWIPSGFRITAPAQPSATGLPCIRPCCFIIPARQFCGSMTHF